MKAQRRAGRSRFAAGWLLGVVFAAIGALAAPPCRAGLNSDNIVNTADLGLVLGFFGQACLGCGCPESGPESLMAGTVEAPSSPLLREFGFADAASYVEWLDGLSPLDVERHLEECVEFIRRAESAR